MPSVKNDIQRYLLECRREFGLHAHRNFYYHEIDSLLVSEGMVATQDNFEK
jgi:hypothetical protein